MSAPSTVVAILRALLANTEPGQWDAMDGHVTSDSGALHVVDGRSDRESLDYYGGYLICESVPRKDAAFIAAAHNLLPELLDGFDALRHQVWKLQLELRCTRDSLDEAEKTIEFERSRRYVAPLRPLERAGVVRIRDDNRVETVEMLGDSAA